MKKNLFEIFLGILLILLVGIAIILVYKKEKKQHFLNECPYCHSKNIEHKKPVFKYIENYVIPSTSGLITKPIAHFDVEYHCKDCNRTFHKELEVDLLSLKNRGKYIVEPK